MKKDILAAIIFLTTGLLFYAVQTAGKADALRSSGGGCDAAETVAVTKAKSESEKALNLKDWTTRAS